tara:strand:- start:111 stop:341 length:231 start_codon:yes stop_codon:yes gene_type:complete
MSSFKFSDEVIAQVARLVQLAIITGTDIVDNLRMISVVESNSDEGVLVLTDEYRQVAEDQLAKLMGELEEASTEMT